MQFCRDGNDKTDVYQIGCTCGIVAARALCKAAGRGDTPIKHVDFSGCVAPIGEKAREDLENSYNRNTSRGSYSDGCYLAAEHVLTMVEHYQKLEWVVGKLKAQHRLENDDNCFIGVSFDMFVGNLVEKLKDDSVHEIGSVVNDHLESSLTGSHWTYVNVCKTSK